MQACMRVHTDSNWLKTTLIMKCFMFSSPNSVFHCAFLHVLIALKKTQLIDGTSKFSWQASFLVSL